MSAIQNTTPLNAAPVLVTAQPHLVKPRTVPMKIGLIGDQGSGKSTTAALLSAALSKEIHNGAPVWVTDPELGWKFPNVWLFKKEKIELVQRTVPTFKAMMQDLRDAEKSGACVWNVELVKLWLELLKACQKASPSNWGSNLSAMWNDYVAAYLNSPLHCFAMGRVGDVTEEVFDEQNNIRRIKTGEKMKAGGSNNFAYEPDLVLRMYLEQKPKRRKGVLLEGEGRMVHCAYVQKDRSTLLNGMTMRWSDKAGYAPGGYRQVWESLRPFFLALQETENVKLDTAASSESMIDRNGDSEWYQRQAKKKVLAGEFRATIELLWGGQSKDAKDLRLLIFERIFGFRSPEAYEEASLEVVERGAEIMKAFERRVKADKSIMAGSRDNLLAHLDIDIQQHDQDALETADLPF